MSATTPSYYLFRYPADLIDVWTLPDGTRVTLRPVLPQDQPLIADFLEDLSRATRQQRFRGVGAFSASQLAQMSQIDYRYHLAFVATIKEDEAETIVADARYVVDDHEHACADFALVVHDHWQRRGIGTRAVQALSEVAHRRGLRWLRGEVGSDNPAMLAFAQQCGFLRTRHPDDDTLLRIEKPLVAPRRGKRERKPTPERGGWLARLLMQGA
jgi:acetyltransferase